MCGDRNTPTAIQEIEVAEDAEKPESHKEDGTGAKDSAVVEKKNATQEKTSAAVDDAAKKCVILMSED
jgi:hypothetical protein